jgi:hypothetical protein
MPDKNIEESNLKEVLDDFKTELNKIENESVQEIIDVIKKDDAEKVSKAIKDIRNII